MSCQIYNCSIRAADIANTLQITDKTTIDYLAKQLEVAYSKGQIDYIKSEAEELGSATKVGVVIEDGRVAADNQ